MLINFWDQYLKNGLNHLLRAQLITKYCCEKRYVFRKIQFFNEEFLMSSDKVPNNFVASFGQMQRVMLKTGEKE